MAFFLNPFLKFYRYLFYLIRPSKLKRTLFFLITDCAIFLFSFYISLLLRFNFQIPLNYLHYFPEWILLYSGLKIVALGWYRIYNLNWRFIGLADLLKILMALTIASGLVFILDLFFQYTPSLRFLSMPKTVLMIDYFISLFFILFLRISKRAIVELINSERKREKRVLIVGAGNAGERIAREMRKGGNYYPVGFLDDDEMKLKTYIHNIPVLGRLKELKKVVEREQIDTIIIAISSFTHREIKKIFDEVNNLVKEIKIVPPLNRLPEEIPLRRLSIEDLLYREPVKIDLSQVGNFFKNETVLVTGGAGSIGSEIVRQLLNFNPKKVVIFDIDETELFNLQLELAKWKKTKIEIEIAVGDIREREGMEQLFKRHNPTILFHAAAYKHVPLMEHFPDQAIKTNIIGTYNLAKIAQKFGVKKFINISTDKAVNPANVMGATKRMAELICQGFNQNGKTAYISVRFGNVLGSRGSVIPIFLKQIREGGPVTVTHPEVERYFMTIKEAVLLVFQATTMGKGGEVFVLDMGEPIKIVKLAETLIKLQGFIPYRDIPIKFTGLRPGEKLSEELLTPEEGTSKTTHYKIFIANSLPRWSQEEVDKIVEQFRKGGGRELLFQLVKTSSFKKNEPEKNKKSKI